MLCVCDSAQLVNSPIPTILCWLGLEIFIMYLLGKSGPPITPLSLRPKMEWPKKEADFVENIFASCLPWRPLHGLGPREVQLPRLIGHPSEEKGEKEKEKKNKSSHDSRVHAQQQQARHCFKEFPKAIYVDIDKIKKSA